ncbi:alpha-galactosidase (plasmid) [Fulvitalea axinellae]|uniref:Alpha-galactosidase n=1 Tax=Fulvitalea axinellae TaxID=1182444 RepID=A0AAU9DF09_9BACT|nr:alpha-galactosidase [Fulvitalea axinellae]
MLEKTTPYFYSLILLLFSPALFGQNIHIHTGDISMLYQVTKGKKVEQVHFGKRLPNLRGTEHNDGYFGEIYPSFGNGESYETALIVRHDDGTLATDLYYLSHTQNSDNGIQTTVIRLKDEKKNLYVDLNFKAHDNENVIEQWAVIRNKEKGAVQLQQFASSSFRLKAVEYRLLHFNGSREQEMNLTEEKLTNGIKNIETKLGTRATENENPSFMLALNGESSEDYGEVYAGALAWSGNYKLSFQVDDKERCHINAGINPFTSYYNLDPGLSFKSPKMILTYSANGKNKASINLHRWARKHGIRHGDQLRPIVLNSWRGVRFNFDSKKLKEMIDGASRMGVEIFVLDDGWFGNKYPRNSAIAGLGDWEVNKKKLPEGLDHLIDYAEKKGMGFGIWVEPEMVNPKSNLAKKHPEWILQRMNGRKPLLLRNQSLLDLSNPKVQDFAFNVVDRLLTEHPKIKYIKWDANRHLQNFGSTYLSKDRQSHLWIEYAKGFENVLRHLSEKYPETIFQTCASGGGRVEYGALQYTDEFWASDNTDPFERLFIQWGTNHIYPPIATSSHVTETPDKHTGKTASLKFRFDIAMSGRLGIELVPEDLNLSELAYAQSAISLYKRIRPIIQFGDLYRLQSPYDNDGYASIAYVRPDKSEAVAMTYGHDYHRRFERNMLRFKGLDPNKVYRIQEINRGKNRRLTNIDSSLFSGRFLMGRGIWVNLRRSMASAMFHLKEVKTDR